MDSFDTWVKMLTYNYLFDTTMDNETQFVDVFKSGIINFKNCFSERKISYIK